VPATTATLRHAAASHCNRVPGMSQVLNAGRLHFSLPPTIRTP
jgi:hypothetical protein